MRGTQVRRTRARASWRRYGRRVADSRLGEFLSARRAAADAGASGLPTTGTRRVAGLRREEVAVLAGLSADYYARLEQGRERHPSPQVLEALTRAYDLDPDAREHLFRLAGTAAPALRPAQRAQVSAELLQTLDQWSGMPALVIDGSLDVLARNALAAAMHSGFALDDNLARMAFLDPEGRRYYVDWERACASAAGHLRLSVGRDPDDERLGELVAELLAGSGLFRELWGRHEPRGKSREAKRFHHPQVGPLTLEHQSFDVRGAPGQQLVIYPAEPGSPSEGALRLLGSLAVDPAAATPRPAGGHR
ncbi:MAG: Putative DNA-binding protein [uncultured Quadrisphaera sp.]|uniref:DNA-binding protein n=1 Tax=uncultured Quadrisphaera sp. TaxID=904978 RepID=A0A6J4P2C2_9ACTN|nr:MAG: Putative DNA-binding protein [uncultured Quadrisphaera sp.]